ncbi:uncharacterized protein TRIADDRAFT_53351 [Trichoplax adhaerens]|uniref:Uncharacterized protein n=1 Tax=Trichoplax adhaerens TaxID=10228 RepID=B3RNZ9_TRIAD|nr:hypothetical protein TRIADDRAFT_53351 [Trichoplax adhaerens]EDV28105.1 hypothetical protein TRIADDRAFT_53351 [Trichoplax adhaerens]|eukprot:XP_002109939.1 hypothetical protein TRIADDRAFT_53351 [Trichoplax adhaerens]
MTSALDIRHWHEAIIQFEQGNVDAALDFYHKITTPLAKIWYDIAMAFWSTGNYSEAIKVLTYSVERDQYFAVAYLQLGILHALQDNLEESLRNFNQVVQCLRSNSFIDYKQIGMPYKLWCYQVLYNIAVVESMLNMKDDAKEMLECAKEYTVNAKQLKFVQDALEKLQNGSLPSKSLCYPTEMQVFKPPVYKTSQLDKRLDFLGKAKVVTSVKIYDLPESPSSPNSQNPLDCKNLSASFSPSAKLPGRPPPPIYKPPASKKGSKSAKNSPTASPVPSPATKSPVPARPPPPNRPPRIMRTDDVNGPDKKTPKRPPPPSCPPKSNKNTTSSSKIESSVRSLANSASRATASIVASSSSSSQVNPSRPPPPKVPPPKRTTPRIPPIITKNIPDQNVNFSADAKALSASEKSYVIVKIHCTYTRAFRIKTSIRVDELKELIRGSFEPPVGQIISLWTKQDEIPVCIDSSDTYNQILNSGKVYYEMSIFLVEFYDI